MTFSHSKSTLQAFRGATYSPHLRPMIQNLAVPMWSADELWGEKDSEQNFRNCLVGEPKACAETWKDWLGSGVFSVDAEFSFYILEHRFSFRGKAYQRWAVFGTLSVDERFLKLHEGVSLDGVENTRERFAQSAADLTPIFVGTPESDYAELRAVLEPLVRGKKEKLIYEENPETIHRLWRISDSEGCAAIEKFFRGRELYLLDGHHRVHGARENQKRGLGDGRLLACVCSMAPEDLLILPIHRAVLFEEWLSPGRALSQLEQSGCELVSRQRWSKEGLAQQILDPPLEKNEFYLIPAQSAEIYRLRVPAMKTKLVVEHIEQEIFSAIPGANLLPVNDVQFLVEQLARGQAQAGILLPSVEPAIVRFYADANLVMPRKSTQFFPKPAIGLVCRPWGN